MNKVVVGFDFSSGSANAVDLAIDIANRWQSDIRLVYVKEKKEAEEPIREEIERRNEGVAHLLQGIKLEYVLRSGDPATELAKQAEADNAALVVVGTHGMSGAKPNMLGHNSHKLIERSPVPVLIVREDFDFNKNLETIVVPIDSSDDTRQKAAMAATFAKAFGSTIHLLGLYTSTNKDIRAIVNGYIKMLERHLEKSEVKFVTKYLEVKKNVTLDTLDYATSVKADMIAIMTEQENSFSNLFLGTYAQQMVNMSRIPVLTVRPKQVQTENANY